MTGALRSESTEYGEGEEFKSVWSCFLHVRRMIDKTQIIETVLRKVAKLPVGHHLILLTYKRNRSVIIARTGDDDLLVIERGYQQERFQIPPEKLKGLLKTLIKREFPRSRKIRLHAMGTFIEEEALQIPWKIL